MKNKKSRMSFSFVYPAFNEQDNIAEAIQRADRFLKKRFTRYEIVVVNDGSRDNTKKIILTCAKNNPKVRLINNARNLGYGATVWKGLRAAKYNLIFLNDSDLQFDLRDLDKFLNRISEADVVIGYRTKRSEGFVRWLNSYLWVWLVNLTLRVRVRDIDCAFKLFKRQVIRSVEVGSHGAMFSAELLYEIKSRGYHIIELPVCHRVRQHGSSTGANLMVIATAFYELWQFLIRKGRLR